MEAQQQVEQPAAETAAPQETTVGVLGWLGFIIINFAAWGIISTASYITWVFGFVICGLYTAGLAAFALYLERRDKVKYRPFLNLLWVLTSTFVFVCGSYLALQVIGRIGASGSPTAGAGNNNSFITTNPSGQDYSRPDSLPMLLPVNRSSSLDAWANTDYWNNNNADKPNFVGFSGSLYFSGQLPNTSTGRQNVLLRASDLSGADLVTPTIRAPSFFCKYDSKLYFMASASGFDDQIWSIESATPGEAVSAISPANLSRNTSNQKIYQLFSDSPSSALYFKGNYECSCGGRVWTIYRSDGTLGGTVDLRGDVCPSDCGGGGGGDSPGGGSSDRPPRKELWGMLFLAVLPMMMLAGYVLKRKQLPGPFVNVYGGIEGAVIIIYLLAVDSESAMYGFGSFLKWFITLYNSVFWLLIAVWSLKRPSPPEWQEELKTWAVLLVGVSFFVIIHIDLEIPFRDDAWRWIVYAILTVVQLALSSIVSRTVPMVTGAAGLFALSWKISYELVEFAGFSGDEFKMLTLMSIMALQGTGIVLGAIWYSSRRDKFDEGIRALFTCDKETFRRSFAALSKTQTIQAGDAA